MKIAIAEKLTPFSHLPGTACVIPGTNWEIEAYPSLLRIGKREFKWDLTGPVAEFTLQQDLEKNCVYVFGKAKQGYFRLQIRASDSGIDLYADRIPSKGFGALKSKGTLHLATEVPFVSKTSYEKLSLGSHKAQDWDLIQRRCDLKEMLPILFALGQRIPYVIPPQKLTGAARLLELPKDRNSLEDALLTFFKAAFTKLLIPRLTDDHYQGLIPEEPVVGDRFFLIQQGCKMVRGLFFRQNERRIELLPLLPPSIDCGRMIGVKADGIGEIDFEWSKKMLKKVIIRADVSGDAVLELPREIKRYRIRKNLREKGFKQERDEPLKLEAKKTFFLDLFQK